MAILQAGNTVIGDGSNATFNVVTVSSNGYIEIPDSGSFSVNSNVSHYSVLRKSDIQGTNSMWSWWIKPLILRDQNATNNWTYTCFTQSNGAVGLLITNHKTGNTAQYTINSSLTFNPDDHNASSICAGNGKVTVFMQGRVARLPANANNMFYIEFDEGTNPSNKIVNNVTFSTVPTSTTSGYPNTFNANGKFLLIGRQQQPITANQWLAVTGDWPVSNLSAPKGFFRSGYSWTYFALRRSYLDKDVINFAQGWHPYNTTSNHDITYGKILRNGNSAPWDVYSNNTIIGNLTTGSGLPFSEENFEKVYASNNYSMIFDGSGDRFTINSSAALNPGANNFTFECWVYPISWSGTFHAIFVNNVTGGLWIGKNGSNFVLRAFGVADFVSHGTLPPLNKWTHIAVSRIGSAARIFYNGIIVASNTSFTYTFAQGNSFIGDDGGASAYYNGYLSNIRLLNGTGLYPTAGTLYSDPPRVPLTVIANTALLTANSNTIVDFSNNNFTITAAGDAKSSQFGPFIPDTVRLFDVHDDAVAFGTFDTTINVIQYKMAYKANNTWSIYTICDGGAPFHGVRLRDYFGGMSISERDKFTVTVSVENAGYWEIREYKYLENSDTWFLISNKKHGPVKACRPMDEVLSEDSHIYINTDNLASMYWVGEYSGSNYESFSTNTQCSRLPGPGISATAIDSDKKVVFTSVNINPNSYIEVN
jgi:hypothetical protein